MAGNYKGKGKAPLKIQAQDKNGGGVSIPDSLGHACGWGLL